MVGRDRRGARDLDDAREAARHRLAGPADLAALQQRGVDHALAVEHAHRQGQGLPRLVHLVQFPLDATGLPEDPQRVGQGDDLLLLERRELGLQLGDLIGRNGRVQDRLPRAARQHQGVAADAVGRRDVGAEIALGAREHAG